ncbi:hypothetical protein B5K06_10960 [Rhizobium grahamii]|uniref:Uncharacterized protein n=1 Tax=Rhizobium grahamii TaxID=1120045 RepID=A0A370KR25_9HYPH|nr:hypothetical protein B5K06_10960 [Rhizobium grahamii]
MVKPSWASQVCDRSDRLLEEADPFSSRIFARALLGAADRSRKTKNGAPCGAPSSFLPKQKTD